MLFYVVECFTVNLEISRQRGRERRSWAESMTNPGDPVDSFAYFALGEPPRIKSTKSALWTRSGEGRTIWRNSAPSFFTVCWRLARPLTACLWRARYPAAPGHPLISTLRRSEESRRAGRVKMGALGFDGAANVSASKERCSRVGEMCPAMLSKPG